MKKSSLFFVWIMLLAIAIMVVITVTQVITNTSQNALENGNKQAAKTFAINNRLEELVNISFALEKRILQSKNKPFQKNEKLNSLKDSLTQLDYNTTVLQKTWDDSTNKKGLSNISNFIGKQVDISFKLLAEADSATIKNGQKIYVDSLAAMHIGDSIYVNAIAFQKQLEKLLSNNLYQSNKATNQLAALNFLLAIISLLAVLLLVTIIIRRQKKQLILINDLEIAKAAALQSSEIKDRFLANMSHEIRTPLNALQGFSKLLSKTNLDKVQLRYSRIMETASHNLLNIVNDILDFSKIESDSLYIRKNNFYLKTELREIEIMFEALAAEKGLTLQFITPKISKLYLAGDNLRLKQILVNLIGNAIKFTAAGSVTLTTTILQQNEKKCELQFTVTDTGMGIPQDYLENIFVRFEQIDNSFSRKYGGTGLGLSIVKKLITLMGGKIEVNSTLNDGATFKVMLGFDVIKTEIESTVNTTDTDIYTNVFVGKIILIAEDNEMNSLLMKSILLPTGATLHFVKNGYEAVNEYENLMPNVVLMDVQMPGMDGLEATKKIRQKHGNVTPIVAITAHVLEQEKQHCLEVGMNFYLTKPIDQTALLQLLQNIFELNVLPAADVKKTPLPTLQGFNYLSEICGGNQQKMLLILNQLAKQIPIEIANLQNCIKDKDVIGLRKIMHNFKSTLSALDATDSAVVAIKHFETNLAASSIYNWKLIEEEAATFVKALQNCVSGLQKIIV